jgi:hypothetical protein
MSRKLRFSLLIHNGREKLSSFLLNFSLSFDIVHIMSRKKDISLPPIFLILTIFLLLPTSSLTHETFTDVFSHISQIRDGGTLPIVIFDLDGTLFNNGPRSKQIFLDFAEERNDTTLEVTLGTIDANSMKYRVRETLIEVGITDSTLLSELMVFWKSKFFTSEYLRYDEPIAGGVEFVNELHDSGALIIYLTGRDMAGTLEGTVSSLKDHKYPIGILGTELIMKPERYMKTVLFKEESVTYIKKLGTVIAIFENEPENINNLITHFKESLPFFLETGHKPSAPPVKKGIPHIHNFLKCED